MEVIFVAEEFGFMWGKFLGGENITLVHGSDKSDVFVSKYNGSWQHYFHLKRIGYGRTDAELKTHLQEVYGEDYTGN